MSPKNQPTKSTLAQNRARLETLLEELESDQVPLDQIHAKLEAAANLTTSIERELNQQKASIEVLKQRFDTSS